jgi:hypothetical protein
VPGPDQYALGPELFLGRHIRTPSFRFSERQGAGDGEYPEGASSVQTLPSPWPHRASPRSSEPLEGGFPEGLCQPYNQVLPPAKGHGSCPFGRGRRMVILRVISAPSDLEINSGTIRSSNSMDIHYPKQKSGFRPKPSGEGSKTASKLNKSPFSTILP